MTTGRSELVKIEVKFRVETSAAHGVADPNGGDDLIWLPKSQCEKLDDETLEMPEWLAVEKGLV